MSKLLTLIPDTNLFVQCEALETLDWQRWPNFDEIHVLVTRPVQREIDNHKNKGNDRLSKRARTTSALFRAVIVGREEFKIIRVDKPTVKLFIRPEIAPSPELEPPLDYSRNDDAIVGTAHAFAKSVGSAATRLLTHDTGPMATAKMLGVPFEVIPDKWLLKPENNETQSALNRALAENQRLRAAEPKFEIRCLDGNSGTTKRIQFERRFFKPLMHEHVMAFLAQIKAGHPKVTNFGDQEQIAHEVRNEMAHIAGVKRVYQPAKAEDVAEYLEVTYPKWEEACVDYLDNLHNTLCRAEEVHVFTFEARNVGTRPGNHALITISAQGPFLIYPFDEEEAEQRTQLTKIRLPQPPVAPCGHWNTIRDVFASLDP